MSISNDHRFRKSIVILALSLLAGLPQMGKTQTDPLMIIREISFTGNKVTRDHIISRELMFSEGDTLSQEDFTELLEKSRENLLNTSLFNFVNAEWHTITSTYLETDVLFSFTERWYIWPWPIIEFADRNINTWWTENRDLTRMSYGVDLRWGNLRGRREELNLTAVFGYNEKYGLNYTIPYLNKKRTLGLGIGAFYGRTHEVPVMNLNDKLVYFRDDDDYVMHEVNSAISLIYRREIYNTHTFRLEYDLMDFADTLNLINPGFTPEGKEKLQYFSLMYQFKSDHRDDKPYPLEGHYFDLELAKRGFNVFDNGGIDVFYVRTTFRQYFKLGNRWYVASGLNCKFSNEAEQPFYMDRAIGYGRDIVRGYEYYVVNGQNFGILKNNLKFALLPERGFDIDFISSEKFNKVHYAFYLNAFFDMGYADNIHSIPEQYNQLENSLLIGYGLGLDFVTYYDLVLRVEYSFNRLNEHGLFLHFIAPI